MSEPVYSRAPDVVWRLGPDRVLVRRIGDRGDDAAADLTGGAALVWVALDEPATLDVALSRLPSTTSETAASDLDLLLESGWLVSSRASRPTTER